MLLTHLGRVQLLSTSLQTLHGDDTSLTQSSSHAPWRQPQSVLLLCITVLEAEVAQLGQAVAAAKVEYDAAAARLEELRHRLKECDRDISALAADKAALAQQLTDLAVDKKKLQHKYAVWPACMHMA